MSDYQGNIVIKNPATPAGPFENGAAPGVWKLSEVLPFVRQGIWPTQGIQGKDTFFPYVSLLLSTTALGNANNNLFVDSSGAFNPISRTGNTTQGSFTPYGASWSNYFDGTGDYLTVPDDNALDFGTGDFTIEMWINAQNLSSVPMFFHKGTSVSTGWFFQTSGSTLYFGQLDSNRYSTWSVSLANNAWYHIALTRVGAVLNVFVNGVSQGAQTVTNANLSNDNTGLLYIGEYINGTYYYQGYLSNYRVVKGSAVYTSNFTVPTSPLTAISGTSLLTCQSNRFRDASANNFTVTPAGNTSVTEFSPFAPAYPGISYNQSDITNWSGYFASTGTDGLSFTSTSAVDVSTGDFTFECWVYFNGFGSDKKYIIQISGGSYWQLVHDSSFGISLRVTGYSEIVGQGSNSGWVVGQWYHVALVRSGNNWNIYRNGVSIASATNSSSIGYYSPTYVANYSSGNSINGYMSNVRLVKGTAVYTSTFTPPTSPLTAISGTGLLTLQNAAFTDNSTNNFVITPSGNATVTGNSPFNPVGYWSNYFNGGTNYLTTSSTTWTQLGTGDFTVEGWGYINAYGTYFPLCDTRASATFSPWIFGVNSSGFADFYYGTTAGGRITDTVAVGLNTWVHLAAVRSGSTITLYVNGVSKGTATYSSAMNGGAATIGRIVDGYYANGYISNFRVVVGTAVYTSNFTPPTTPLTAISGTQVLTCQNGRIIDNSTNNSTITVTGTVSTQSFDPFYTATIASNGGSMYFDGTGDYLTSPTNVNYDFASSNFTIEGWFYFTNGSANQLQCLYSNYTNFSSAGSIYFGKHSSSGSGCVSAWFSNYSTGVPLLTDPTLPPSNAWTHYALVRNSNTFTLYRNGVSVASASFSGAATSGACPAFIGVPGDALVGFNYFFPGYMNGFRITKGTAVYTANFTPPTAPLTPSASTTLLLNGMNAGAYDATAINNMETVGNAQVRFPSPFAPANYWAGVFDGNGDYLTSPSNAAFALGTGDYTVECWIYATSTPSDQGIYEGRSTGTTSDGFTLTAFSGSVIRIFSGGVLVASTGTSYVGQWTHVAVTRASGTTTLWINGVSQGTSATSYNCTNTDAVVGGGRYTGGTTINTSFPGFISNFRIVKGTAVYTSAFTPSTTPLTAISGTSLLTCQNTTFIDNSTNAFTITAFGNATAGAIGPFTATGGTSMYFDGTGDYLKAPNSDVFAFRTGDFTVEMWAYFADKAATNRPLFDTGVSSNTGRLLIRQGNDAGTSNVVNAFVSGTTVGSPTISFNQWTHVAVVRQSGTVKIYINGTGGTGVSASADLTQNGCLVGAFYDQLAWNFTGYIDDLRVTRGVARYTANFTPPTTAFPVF
jgi:hypothetical protein